MTPLKAVASISILLLLFAPTAHGADEDAILGSWNTRDNEAQFDIYKCGAYYCGRISWLEEPNYSPGDTDGPAGRPKTDRKNPDHRLRDRPLLGMTLLEEFRYEGGNTWRGKIYDPETGNTYSSTIKLPDKDHLKLRGYVGISLLGRTETWTRSTGARRFN